MAHQLHVVVPGGAEVTFGEQDAMTCRGRWEHQCQVMNGAACRVEARALPVDDPKQPIQA